MSEKRRPLMTFEEFKERVLYLLFKDMFEAEASWTRRDLDKLLREDLELFECLYESACYEYNLG